MKAGSVRIAAAVVGSLSASGAFGAVSFFDIFYSTYYTQQTPAPPVSYTGVGFSERVTAEAGDFGTVVCSSPPDVLLGLPELFAGYFFYSAWFNDEADALVAFPDGDYTFIGGGGTLGLQQGRITRPPDAFWCAEVPAFSPECFEAMQQADASNDFMFEFNTFGLPPEANLGVTFLSISDASNNLVFIDYFDPGEGFRIVPAATLQPGTHYTAYLYFSCRIQLDSEAFGGSVSIAAFDRVTSAALITRSACVGDLNNDGLVDDSDFVPFASAYNLLDCADPLMPPGCPADLNGDGFVDDSDFVIFVAAYNELLCP